MGNEQEYIELFGQNRELIDSACAELLNREREQSFARFKASGFPTRKDEEWRNTPIAKQFGINYGMNLKRAEANMNTSAIFHCDVPNLKSHRVYIVNDSYSPDEGHSRELPQGVILGSLNAIAGSHPTLLDKYYNRLACDGDSIAQFNTMFAQDGVVLYVPRNTVVEETIQIVSLIQANVEMLLNRRILIILEENSKANILLCDHSSQEKQSLSTLVTEVFVGAGASLNIYDIEETANNNTRVATLLVKQEADSHFNHCCITLTNGFTRNSTNVALTGRGAETSINGLAIGDKTQHIDNHTLVDHKVPDCTSNELYKYILDESSTGVFAGKMHIHPDAQRTASQQTNRNLCLTNCAQMYAQPQLEIYADDVKCSHGSTVGQLDENALFYMQQRGIPADEARHLLMYAFAGEVIENIDIVPLKERLHILIEKRFRGELGKCKGCNLCK
ncbi:MAG: Fe-S cluster assembly protein SufD [Bacteroidaceae bacterium]|nr:Fe-S cluster assembly protein SufD [Bacteroidaceae bacterium]